MPCWSFCSIGRQNGDDRKRDAAICRKGVDETARTLESAVPALSAASDPCNNPRRKRESHGSRVSLCQTGKLLHLEILNTHQSRLRKHIEMEGETAIWTYIADFDVEKRQTCLPRLRGFPRSVEVDPLAVAPGGGIAFPERNPHPDVWRRRARLGRLRAPRCGEPTLRLRSQPGEPGHCRPSDMTLRKPSSVSL